MIIRKATTADIVSMQDIRNTVTENALSDTSLISYDDYKEYITTLGVGWVGVVNDAIVGFAVVSVEKSNVWALFIKKEFEGTGLAQRLHDEMLAYYFTQTKDALWLSTGPGTRAEYFYRKNKWTDIGMHGKEVKFEMSYDDYVSRLHH